MNAEHFYQQVIASAAQPPPERHTTLSRLHTEILAGYLEAVRAITPEKAAQPVKLGSETRTLAQVVGHIAEWERFMIHSAGDIMAGLEHPRMVTSIEGYVEPDGQVIHFDSIDAFNTYQADKHAAWDWARIQALAIDTATTLHALFTHPQLLSAERLEKTRRYRKRLTNGVVLNDIAMGWNLWLTVLDHAAVEHAAELGMDK